MSVKINCYCCGNPFTIQDDGLPDRACRCHHTRRWSKMGGYYSGVSHCAACLKCERHCKCEDRPAQHENSYLAAWKLWAAKNAPSVLSEYIAIQERRKKEAMNNG